MSAQRRRPKGSGSIFPRKDKLWGVKLLVGHKQVTRSDGSTVSIPDYKTAYARTKKEAGEKLEAMKRQRDAGVDLKAKPQTLAEFLPLWLDGVTKRGKLSVGTLTLYRWAMTQHLIPALGDTLLRDLSVEQVERFFLRLKAQGHGTRGTMGPIHAVLLQALDQAERWGRVPRNVAHLAEMPEYDATKPGHALTPDEAKRFVLAIQGHQWEGIYLLAIALGLRRGEVLGLRWADVDTTTDTIQITQQLTAKRVIQPPKTARSCRELPLLPILLPLFQAQRIRQAEWRLRIGKAWQETGLVWTREDGSALVPGTVDTSYKRLLATTDLPAITFHDLRRSCNSLLDYLGASDTTKLAVMGHASVDINRKVYTHAYADQTRGALTGLSDLLMGS